jgi:dTDP-4-dehydrorhamnose reductase
MKIIVFGGRGMLGSTLVRKLVEAGYDPEAPTCRILEVKDVPDLSSYDLVFNCLGAIPQKKGDYATMVWANTVVPRLLSRTARKLVHFSTDCVFSGLRNMREKYLENDGDWSTDDYGWTKRNGEISDDPNVLTIRTSIIGHRGPVGLLDWFLTGNHPINTKGVREVKGYCNHHWNGFTTNELANILIKNMRIVQDLLRGVVQLGGEGVSKYYLLCKIKEIYQIDTEVQPITVVPMINKCLETSKSILPYIVIKPLQQQITEMREDELRWGGLGAL